MDNPAHTAIRLAVAEDDPVVRTTFVRLLEALGYRVVCVAQNGEELVDQCIAGRVDLVFTDFHMPVMDGLAAAEIIAARNIPVVLISGEPDAEAIVLDYEPVVALIRKPVTVDILQQTIRRITSNGRSH